MNLKTDYKNAIPPSTGRRYRIDYYNDKITAKITDETAYVQTGDAFGALDINTTNAAVNTLDSGLATANTNIERIDGNIDTIIDNIHSMNETIGTTCSNIEFYKPRLCTSKAGVMFFNLPQGYTTLNCIVTAAFKGAYQYPFYACPSSTSDTQMWVSTALTDGSELDRIIVQHFQ